MVAFNNGQDRLKTLISAKITDLNVKISIGLSSDQGPEDSLSVLEHVNGVLDHFSKSKSAKLPKIPDACRNQSK